MASVVAGFGNLTSIPCILNHEARMSTDGKAKGPASYFPSIEKTYGRPVSEWQQVVRDNYPARHMELVAMLKEEHAMGHGHANALVAHTLAEDNAA